MSPFPATCLLTESFLRCFRAYNVHIIALYHRPYVYVLVLYLNTQTFSSFICCCFPNFFAWGSAFINFLRKSHENNAVCCRDNVWQPSGHTVRVIYLYAPCLSGVPEPIRNLREPHLSSLCPKSVAFAAFIHNIQSVDYIVS